METPSMEKLSITVTDKPRNKYDFGPPIPQPQFITMPEGPDHWEVDMPKDCFMILGEERVSTITICANVVLAEFNRNNNTDYELCECHSVCARKLCVGHYRIHCNFCAKTEGEIRWKHFFAEAEFKNGSCTVIDHELLTW
ncbi:hypothetical protein OROHE_018067 [Orobanche hederae]